jgi:hypothetical protein
LRDLFELCIHENYQLRAGSLSLSFEYHESIAAPLNVREYSRVALCADYDLSLHPNWWPGQTTRGIRRALLTRQELNQIEAQIFAAIRLCEVE